MLHSAPTRGNPQIARHSGRARKGTHSQVAAYPPPPVVVVAAATTTTREETRPAAPLSFPLLASTPPLPFACRSQPPRVPPGRGLPRRPALKPRSKPRRRPLGLGGSSCGCVSVMNARGRRKAAAPAWASACYAVRMDGLWSRPIFVRSWASPSCGWASLSARQRLGVHDRNL